MSSMKSASWLSSSSPMGVSRDMGAWESFNIFRTFPTGKFICLANSSLLGSLPYSCTNFCDCLVNLLMVSIIWTGILMVLAWSQTARVMA